MRFKVNLQATIGSSVVVEAADFSGAQKEAEKLIVARLRGVGTRVSPNHIVVTSVEVTTKPEGMSPLT